MSLRAWARSRGVPSSTAHKAAKAGRITRDATGRVDPELADREWTENTRPRIDGRVPQPPESGAGQLPIAPEGAYVLMRDAVAVSLELEALLVQQLVAMVNRWAGVIAELRDSHAVRETLYAGIAEAWDATDVEWRRRYP